MNLSNVDDVDSAELSPDTDPKPKRRPRWQIELEAHNGVPTNPSSRSRRNSRNSTLAKEDSVALAAVAAVSTTPIAKENENKIAQSTTATSLTSINRNESNAVCRTSTSTTSSAASSSKTVHHTFATPTTSFVPIKKEKKYIDKNKIIPAKKTSHVKHKKAFSTIATTSAVAAIPQIVPSTSTATSSVGQNIKNVTRVVAAVPKITPASTAPSSAGQNVKKVDTVETMEMKKKKGRIRKPRRIIPKDKEYIPVDEQPAPADVVGGRGGECRISFLVVNIY